MELQKCSKCRENEASIKSRSNKVLCSECFLMAIGKKLKVNISRRLNLRKGGKVLVAYSGGHASSLMVDTILSSISQSNSKRMILNVGIIHINELPLLNSVLSSLSRDSSDTESVTSKIQKHLEALADEYSVELYLPEINHGMKESREELVQILMDQKSDQQRQDLLACIRNRLIVTIAQQNDYDIIFFGESADRLASNSFSMISRGQGFSVPSSVQVSGNRFGFPISHPLKDTLSRECALYCRIKEIQTFITPNLITGVTGTVNQLCEDFICKLQQDYESTVPNVLRTLGKLEVLSSERCCKICGNDFKNVGDSVLCRLCAKLDNIPQEWLQ